MVLEDRCNHFRANSGQINLYEPAILVVGTRGKSLGGFQGLLPGSVSKYCLQHSPVPVIVVRPSSKRDKARNKRANDPNRIGYQEMLAKSESLLDVTSPSPVPSPRGSFIATDDQAAAVTASIQAQQVQQYAQRIEPSPLAQVHHAESSDDEKDYAGSLLKSPELQNLDSPELSSVSSSEDEDDHGGVSTKPRSLGGDTFVSATAADDATTSITGNATTQQYEPIQFQPFQPASAAELAASRAAANEREAAYVAPEAKQKVDHRSAAQRIMEGV